jgi:hypothetical protein
VVDVADLKLPRLPDRTAIKLAIGVPPDLHQQLREYAAAYEATYGKQEAVADLIPFMLQAFLDGDRGFQRQRQASAAG